MTAFQRLARFVAFCIPLEHLEAHIFPVIFSLVLVHRVFKPATQMADAQKIVTELVIGLAKRAYHL
jgi:hypothetical protein